MLYPGKSWNFVASVLAGFLFVIPSAVGQTFSDASDMLPLASDNLAIGSSLFDINSDGLVDLYQSKRLFVQQPDGSLTDLFESLGLTEELGIVFGAVAGDYNADGFLDLFFMNLTESSQLYLNRAGMYFVESNMQTGIVDQSLVQGSIWTDFDENGQLDLFVGRDLGESAMFLNNNNQFDDIGPQIGLGFQAVYGAVASDFDQDGDIDIFLTQCFSPDDTVADNLLLQNTDGVFENVSPAMGIIDDLPSWGTVWFDYDNDGWLDIFVANLPDRNFDQPNRAGVNKLYKNNAGTSFTDISVAAGVAGDSTDRTIAVSAADFDNDGWEDLIVAFLDGVGASIFRNNGDGTFTDIVPDLAIEPTFSQSVSVADINNDGWIDIYLPGLERQVYLNDGGDNHFLNVSLRGTTNNLYGIGARIDLYAGGMRQVREIRAGDGFMSQNHNLTAHFGLGMETSIDSLVIRWPQGNIDRHFDVAADQHITFVEGIGPNQPPTPVLLDEVAGQIPSTENPLTFSWSASTDNDADDLMYSLHLYGATLDSTLAPQAGTTLDVDTQIFVPGESYRWTVSVSDGYSVRGTSFMEFVVGSATNVEKPEITQIAELQPAYPNPFRNAITIPYEITSAAHVEIQIFDILGQTLSTLVDQFQTQGTYSLSWDGKQDGIPLAPGMYFVRMKVADQVFTKHFVRY